MFAIQNQNIFYRLNSVRHPWVESEEKCSKWKTIKGAASNFEKLKNQLTESMEGVHPDFRNELSIQIVDLETKEIVEEAIIWKKDERVEEEIEKHERKEIEVGDAMMKIYEDFIKSVANNIREAMETKKKKKKKR